MLKKIELLMCSALAFATGMGIAASPAAACGTDAYVGQVCVVTTDYCPNNTLEATGKSLEIATYTALHAVMGCTFGGDCKTTFNLPDLRGRAPVNYGQGKGLTNHPIGQQFGQQAVNQTVNMVAPHIHGAVVVGSSGNPVQVTARQVDATTNIPQPGYMLAQSLAGLDAGNLYVDPTATPGTDVELGGVSGGGAASSITLSNTGGSAAMPTVPPEMALRYCVVTSGIFPPRP